MTCTVGIAEGGRVYMGGDSAVSSGWEVRESRRRKVFKIGAFIIGTCGSVRMSQLLEYRMVLARQGEESDMEYMVNVFIEAVRGCFKEYGYARVENNEESGGSFLVGYRGKLYLVASDFQVTEYGEGYDALGSGASYALGVMYTLRGEADPKKRIMRALAAAAHFSGGVQRPFYIITGATK